MAGVIVGWDVGGANIKASSLDVERRESDPVTVERPFPLWREPDRLAEVLLEVAGRLTEGGAVSRMGVTMTAELADCFQTRREGVTRVLAAFGSSFSSIPLHVYGLDGRFRSIESALEDPLSVAAANWMASATVVGRIVPDALFLDTGSTTTDVIPVVRGRVVAHGRTDMGRLASGELVYTGALRTPVCAIVHDVPIAGQRVRVAAEHFAIAADAHLWLGNISESGYTCDTPDGRGRDRAESAARLARMVCMDLETLDEADLQAIAERVSDAQVQQIVAAIDQVRSRIGPTRFPARAVIAGHGAFMARRAAEAAGLSICDDGFDVARLGPAAAVAYLLADSGPPHPEDHEAAPRT